MRADRLLAALALTTTLSSVTAAQARMRPAPSGRATTEVTLAYPRDSTPAGAQPATIRIDYGQPHLRGRTLHTDSLVPYGVAWRTGANALTTLTTGVDLQLGGASIPKGSYVLFTLPARAGWKLIVQRNAGQTDARHDPQHDIARVDLRTQTLHQPIEALTMWLVPATTAGTARGELRLAWGTTMLSTDWMVQ
jgi:hypothetical protein